MGQVALYAGSFDPITLGHVDVIRRGATLFDGLVVAVGNNPAKKYMFELDERQALARQAAEGLANVSVVSFDGLLVDTVKEVGATLILRGLRALSDFDTEFRYGLANRDLSGVETLFLLSSPAHIHVSSSLVKEIALNGGDASRFVPAAVGEALAKKFKRS